MTVHLYLSLIPEALIASMWARGRIAGDSVNDSGLIIFKLEKE